MSLQANLQSAITRIGTEFKTLRTQLTGNSSGDLSGLSTANKSSLVSALNELKTAIDNVEGGGGGSVIDDESVSSSTVWSSSKSSSEISTATTNAIAALVGGAPSALDTLNELAEALANDASFSATITAALGDKADKASPAFTGTPTAPTASATTNTTQLATTAFVRSVTGNPEADFVATFEAGL